MQLFFTLQDNAGQGNDDEEKMTEKSSQTAIFKSWFNLHSDILNVLSFNGKETNEALWLISRWAAAKSVTNQSVKL